MVNELVLDFSDRHSDGGRRRRKSRKYLTDWEKGAIRRKLQQVGFTNHEISLWIKEALPLKCRAAQNLIRARRQIMRHFTDRGYDFREARSKAREDTITSAQAANPGMTREQAENYIWGALYPLGPHERRITGEPFWSLKIA